MGPATYPIILCILQEDENENNNKEEEEADDEKPDSPKDDVLDAEEAMETAENITNGIEAHC